MSTDPNLPVILVTGAARGIGRAVASWFAEDGCAVVALDVDDQVSALQDQPGGQIVPFVGDVSDPVVVDRVVAETVDRYGRLDVLVANAGIGGGAPVAELTDEQFRRILDVNLFGVFACCRAAARVMIPRRSGRIITVGSIFGQDPPGGSAAYAASKAGVAALTISLSRELGPHGITVNCVSPGHIETDMYAAALQRRATLRGVSLEEITQRELDPIALGRFGTPDDVAAVVQFLASPAAAYVTGQRINVDGGIQPR
ncbi:MAG: SDR family oxidoreductase [Chloroflexota bacterium]|nr:SDR family oxidoreductase [Chloroflexota bacterium]